MKSASLNQASASVFALRSPRTIFVFAREHIGDLICTTPALRALRNRFPDAKITVEVGENAVAVLGNCPFFDEVLVRPIHQGLRGKADFVRLLRRRKFEMAIILDTCNDCILHVWLGGIPQRVGIKYRTKFISLLTESVPFDPTTHEMVDNFLNVVALLGAETSDRKTEVFPSEQDRESVASRWAEEGIRTGERVVALNPGASAPANRWLPERFAEVGDLLLAQPETRVILLGGNADREFSAQIQHHMRETPIVWTGQFSILELAEVLRRCDVMVTGDTGPMHLAVAMQTPVVALFGPAVPSESGPGYAPGHAVIRHVTGCPNCTKYVCRAERACMKRISALEVVEVVGAFSLTGRKTAVGRVI